MSKRWKRDKRLKQPAKPPAQGYASIGDHKLIGKSLVPPLAQIPGLSLASWVDERLPELLWAALISTLLTREDAIRTFRRVLRYVHDTRPPTFDGSLTHTGLSQVRPDVLADLLHVVAEGGEEREALLPLLLLEGLPARDAWVLALGNPGPHDYWGALMTAVAGTMDHRSTEATDIRWLSVMAQVAIGKLLFQGKIAGGEVVSAMPEFTEGLLCYPAAGDVSAQVRALELAVQGADGPASEWSKDFWNECMRKTPCFPLALSVPEGTPVAATSLARMRQVRGALTLHAQTSRVTTGLDARHDTVFGTANYCINLLHELILGANARSILGRMGLRTILECYVNLAYLAGQDSPDLWKSYRVFGTGQAKLAFLKLNESDGNARYVETAMLRLLANEDIWQDLLPINLGHWDKANLRDLSISAGVKDVYDRFYGWTSTFVHGHWGAVREFGFDVCGNPLHRLHRIPRSEPTGLPDVIPDACELVDRLLGLVSACYPVFEPRVTQPAGG